MLISTVEKVLLVEFKYAHTVLLHICINKVYFVETEKCCVPIEKLGNGDVVDLRIL